MQKIFTYLILCCVVFFNIITPVDAAKKDYFLIPLIYQKQIIHYFQKNNIPKHIIRMRDNTCIYIVKHGVSKNLILSSSYAFSEAITKCYLYLGKNNDEIGDNKLRTLEEVMRVSYMGMLLKDNRINKDKYNRFTDELLIDNVILEKIIHSISMIDIEKEFAKYKIPQPFNFDIFPQIESKEFTAIVRHMLLKEENDLEMLFFFSGYYNGVFLMIADNNGKLPNKINKEDVGAQTLIYIMENWGEANKISEKEVSQLNLYFSAKIVGNIAEIKKYSKYADKFHKIIKNNILTIDIQQKLKELK